MAEVHVERKAGVPWWVWLLAALLLIGLIWWAVAANTGQQTAGGDATVAVTAPADQAGPDVVVVRAIPVVAIRATPIEFIGKPVAGTATVAEVVSDRGFWLRGEEGTDRIFAVLDDSIAESPPDVNAGQQVRLEGIAYDVARLEQLPVKKLEADARQMLQNEPVFLHVQNIEILGEAGAGTGASAGTAGGSDLSAIVASPADYFGQSVSATAKVIEADSDRGFWLDAGGKRLFAILSKSLDTPDPKTDINAGQTLRFTATVYDASRASEVEELKPVTAETRRLLAGEKAFLRVTDVQILNR